jgi:hypothetical protein
MVIMKIACALAISLARIYNLLVLDKIYAQSGCLNKSKKVASLNLAWLKILSSFPYLDTNQQLIYSKAESE